MIKKITKIILIVVMLLGMAFSISNFIFPGKLKAGTLRGTWVDIGGDLECLGAGNECAIGLEAD